jgi:hypothetical protein
MRWGACLVVTGAALGLFASCGPSGVFACESDAQCMDGELLGRCEASGYCSFPDPSCPSGRRYAEHAADRFADECLPPEQAGDTTAGDTGDSVGSGSPTSGAMDPTLTQGSTTDDPASATNSTASSTDEGSTSITDPASTSGPGRSSNDDVTDTMPGSSDDTTTSSRGDPYGECLDHPDCTHPEATCMMETWALPVCNPFCSGEGQSDECPAPASGDAVPACREIVPGQWGCVLDCSEASCPEGMACSPSTIGPFCLWA